MENLENTRAVQKINPSPFGLKQFNYALVSEKAQIGPNVRIGPYSVIGPEVKISNDVKIHEHVIIKGKTTISSGAEIFPFVTIGLPAQDKKNFHKNVGAISIGCNTIIREHTSIHSPTFNDGKTSIGKNSLTMGQVHIAHDCTIGDHVIITQGAIIGGHVFIDDYATIGGASSIHPHVKIGKYAMLGGASMLTRDLVPFGLAAGNRCRLHGANKVGLHRNNFPDAQIKAIVNAITTLYFSGLDLDQALFELRKINNDNIAEIINFIANSSRGLTRPIPA